MVLLVFVFVGVVFLAIGLEIVSCISGTLKSNLPGWAKAVGVIMTLAVGVSFIVGLCLSVPA